MPTVGKSGDTPLFPVYVFTVWTGGPVYEIYLPNTEINVWSHLHVALNCHSRYATRPTQIAHDLKYNQQFRSLTAAMAALLSTFDLNSHFLILSPHVVQQRDTDVSGQRPAVRLHGEHTSCDPNIRHAAPNNTAHLTVTFHRHNTFRLFFTGIPNWSFLAPSQTADL